MSTGTSSGSPLSKLPDSLTAEELVGILERYPPATIAARPEVMAEIIHCIGELDELVMHLTAGIERALMLRGRLLTLFLQAQEARSEPWAPPNDKSAANWCTGWPRMPQE